MVLRLTNDELDLMRTALVDNIRSIRNEERVQCGGASCAAIELCRKRLRLEALLESVDEHARMVRSTPGARIQPMPLRRKLPPDFYPELVA
jgi:hypothetical protein